MLTRGGTGFYYLELLYVDGVPILSSCWWSNRPDQPPFLNSLYRFSAYRIHIDSSCLGSHPRPNPSLELTTAQNSVEDFAHQVNAENGRAPAQRPKRPRIPHPSPQPDPSSNPVLRRSWPFAGGFRGACWNGQALLSADPERQQKKTRFLWGLAQRAYDFILLQETHATDEMLMTWSGIPGYELFVLNGASNSAGIGILVAKAFLAQFDRPPTRKLESIVPGRIGVLRLRGPVGGIDLYSVYFTTGEALADRAAQRAALAAAILPQTTAIAVIGGDFNYTALDADRANLRTCEWTGGTQNSEEQDFQNRVATPHRLVELEQAEFTHRSSTGLSRLDRIYVNMPPSHQLDHVIQCAALEWPTADISAHRPICFTLRPQKKQPDGHRPLPVGISRHADWLHRVITLHQQWKVEEGQRSDISGIRELLLLKRAMQTVGQALLREESRQAKGPPQTQQEELTRIMQFLRAVDQCRFQRARDIARGFLRLQAFSEIDARGGDVERRLLELRDDALHLAKDIMLVELCEQQEQEPSQPQSVRQAKRDELSAKLRRLKPGSTTTIRCMQAPSGELVTSPDAILIELRRHWASVFSAQPADQSQIAHWLRQAYPGNEGLEHFPREDDGRWRIRMKDVAEAVRIAGESAPGPDGLHYETWKDMGEYGLNVLWAALQDLMHPNSAHILDEAYADEADCFFNLGFLCCLPKQATGSTEDGANIYTPENTRPLSIVDTANRILANSARLRWERLLEAWLSPEQRGFLPMRSMLANIIDVEEAAMRTSLTQNEGAIILFDFSAAFPSLSQEFLMRTLEFIGVPSAALNLVKALYHCSSCRLQLDGAQLDGFRLTAGVRQGCPLSPLLYVIAMDGLLRRIRRNIPRALTRAYADDTAAVLQNLGVELPRFQAIFTELAAAANLHLNLAKCVLIPLGDRSCSAVKASISEWCPPWTAMKVADSGKYLGMIIGPGKGNLSWMAPLRKAWDRVRMWEWSKLGLQFAARVWNIFILPILVFVAQLERVPVEALTGVDAMLRKAAYGPGKWSSSEDMYHLRRAFRFATEFRSLAHVGSAAMLRVASWEDCWNGGLQVQVRDRALQCLLRDTDHLVRKGRWHLWYDKAHTRQLAANLVELEQKGVTTPSLIAKLTDGSPRPWPQPTELAARRRFQQAAHLAICELSTYDAECRIRHKVGKFGFHDRRHACRCLRRLRDLSSRVPPRVWAAIFGAIWNRWATWRRRQRRGHPCLLGCGRGEDSIQHYAGCAVTRAFGHLRLGLSHRYCSPLEEWLLVSPQHRDADGDDHWWSKLAVLQYSVMRVTNAMRAQSALPVHFDARRALDQALIEAIRGHEALAGVVRCQQTPAQ